MRVTQESITFFGQGRTLAKRRRRPDRSAGLQFRFLLLAPAAHRQSNGDASEMVSYVEGGGKGGSIRGGGSKRYRAIPGHMIG